MSSPSPSLWDGLCWDCEHFVPHKPNYPRFVRGYWMGDGKCKQGENWDKFPYVVKVETDSCEKFE